MYSFIVLGIIPGTNIQIGFWPMMGLIAICLGVFKMYRHRAARIISDWWHQYDDIADPAHRPIHANRVHRRMAKPAR